MVAGRTSQTGSFRGETNAYAAPGAAVQGAPYDSAYGGVPAYRAPATTEENGFMDSPGGAWAPTLRSFPGGVPDPHRTMASPQRDYRPTPYNREPEGWWTGLGGPGREKQLRHNGQEFVDADGRELRREVGGPGKRAAPDSRRTPPAEGRVTQQMSPSFYTFTRPFDQHLARQFNGEHFSMADHRRTYPVLGMQPVHGRRNTYRVDPPPWDTGMTDYPDNTPYYTGQGQVRGDTEVAQVVNRAWRLT